MVSRRSPDVFLKYLGLEKIWEGLAGSPSRIEQKTECLGLVSVSDLNVSFYKLIFK